ncbi:MAG: hypothetical protein EAZ97_15755 [Bacteroidetes bacterium]|nr:MAG: hypothetical protein EAZ97_15755 [Bacteroidota bacterium]
MKKLRESIFFVVEFDEKMGLLKSKWLPASSEITENEIKEEINLVTDFILVHKPKYCLSDNSTQGFVFNIDIQNWVAATLAMAFIQVGLKKFALLMPVDFITGLALEQTVEEAGNLPFELQYFKDEKDALTWMLN